MTDIIIFSTPMRKDALRNNNYYWRLWRSEK